MQPVGIVSRSRVRMLIPIALALTASGVVGARAWRSSQLVSTPVLARSPTKTPTARLAPVAAPRVNPWDAALLDFTSSDFERVYRARSMFLTDPDRAVPALLTMLDRRDAMPLVNTGDLIYPCATTWYGHGWMVPYQLQWIADRTGWVLEELTFEHFGFAAGSFKGCDETPRADIAAAIARSRVWAAAHSTFRYHDALLSALADAARRDPVVARIRNSWGAPLPMITCDDYAVRITPLLTEIAKGHGDDASAARETLEDPPWVERCAAPPRPRGATTVYPRGQTPQ